MVSLLLYYIIYLQVKFATNTCRRCLMCTSKVPFIVHLFNPILPKRRSNEILSLETYIVYLQNDANSGSILRYISISLKSAKIIYTDH